MELNFTINYFMIHVINEINLNYFTHLDSNRIFFLFDIDGCGKLTAIFYNIYIYQRSTVSLYIYINELTQFKVWTEKLYPRLTVDRWYFEKRHGGS